MSEFIFKQECLGAMLTRSMSMPHCISFESRRSSRIVNDGTETRSIGSGLLTPVAHAFALDHGKAQAAGSCGADPSGVVVLLGGLNSG